MHRQSKDVVIRTGIEARIRRAIRIKSCDVVAHSRAAAAEGRESSSDQNLAVRLNGQRIDFTIGTGIKRGVERPIGIQPRDAVARSPAGTAAAESRKTSSNQYFPICL